MDKTRGIVAASIVSHGHGNMVLRLVSQLLECSEVGLVVVTHNIPEPSVIFNDPRVVVIVNSIPKGFGANHNAAFLRSHQHFWCVLNPDIQLTGNPFPELISALTTELSGLVAPLVKNPVGFVEDSIRYFPTIISLARKILGRDTSRYLIGSSMHLFCSEWVGGMFMLFRQEVFSALNGFDESYFLYYEDVDICIRTWELGRRVLACPVVSVVHDARRDSHRQVGYLKFHLWSMVRYLRKHWSNLSRVSRSVRDSNYELESKAN